MTRKPPTPGDLLVVLNAVWYEFDMLIVAGQLTWWSQPYPSSDPGSERVTCMNWAHNAHVESFLVHARNLLEFFYLSKQPINAGNFVEESWSELRPPFAKTFQLSTVRKDGELATPKDLWQAVSTRLSHVVVSRSAKVTWQTANLTAGFIATGRIFVENLKPEFVACSEGRPSHVDLRPPPSGMEGEGPQ